DRSDIPIHIELSDQAGNTSTPYTVSIRQDADMIDTKMPFIQSIKIPENGLYKIGDSLFFSCKFSEPILLTGSSEAAYITLTVGTKSRTALLLKSTHSDSLVFYYIIQKGDSDKDGIKINNTINQVQYFDLAGNKGLNNFIAPNSKRILVDGVAPGIIQVTAPVSNDYKTGNVLDFAISFSEKTYLSQNDSLPCIGLQVGNKIVNACYTNGSGSNIWIFRYTINEDDHDSDGIQIGPSITTLTAAILDSAGNAADVNLPGTGKLTGIKINPVFLQVSNVITPVPGGYKKGDTLHFFVQYTSIVFLKDTVHRPSLKIVLGNSSRQAVYTEGSGSNILQFSYILQSGDEAKKGILLNNSITLNGNMLRDARGNTAPIILQNIGDVSNIYIDAVQPSIETIVAPTKSIFREKDSLIIGCQFSKKIWLENKQDTPFIRIKIGSAYKNARYFSGSGSYQINFYYIIEERDVDKNSPDLGPQIYPQKGNLLDSLGNIALLNIPASLKLSQVVIDAISPEWASPNTTLKQVCSGKDSIPIASAFAITDDEAGEAIVWTFTNDTLSGKLNYYRMQASSASKKISPEGLSYQFRQESMGTDTILANISDGTNTRKKKLIIQRIPLIQKNRIGSAQTICSTIRPELLEGNKPEGGDGNFSYLWESTTSSEAKSFVTASGINSQKDYQAPVQTNTAFFRRIVYSNDCIDTSAFVKITVLQNGFWTGAKNSHWNNADNWCNNKLPDDSSSVYIGITPNNPVIRDSAKCNNIYLLSNATLTLEGNLKLSGEIQGNQQSLYAKKGSLQLMGKSMQSIDFSILKDAQLKNLIVDNPSGVSVLDGLWLSGSLLLKKGTLYTNGKLGLRETATIEPSALNTTIAGSLQTEKTIIGKRRNYRMLGNPFRHSIALAQLKDSLDITGDGGSGNGFRGTVTNQPSAFKLEPHLSNDSAGFEAGWAPFRHTNGLGENSWNSFTGISFLMRGKPGQGLDGTPAGDGTNGTYIPSDITIQLTGEPQIGSIEYPLTKEKFPAYHLIANPYLSNIQMASL
ncbi:MAG: hypothetical protein RLZZ28_793, partial [Bacteroidota bacterium]